MTNIQMLILPTDSSPSLGIWRGLHIAKKIYWKGHPGLQFGFDLNVKPQNTWPLLFINNGCAMFSRDWILQPHLIFGIVQNELMMDDVWPLN